MFQFRPNMVKTSLFDDVHNNSLKIESWCSLNILQPFINSDIMNIPLYCGTASNMSFTIFYLLNIVNIQYGLKSDV